MAFAHFALDAVHPHAGYDRDDEMPGWVEFRRDFGKHPVDLSWLHGHDDDSGLSDGLAVFAVDDVAFFTVGF